MEELKTETVAMLREMKLDLHLRPTEEMIVLALSFLEDATRHFKSCDEAYRVAQALALKDLSSDVKSPTCSNPMLCAIMSHLEAFLAATPGQKCYIMPSCREGVLKQVRRWRSSSSGCNPCPLSSVVILRGLDPYMLEQDQRMSVADNNIHAWPSS